MVKRSGHFLKRSLHVFGGDGLGFADGRGEERVVHYDTPYLLDITSNNNGCLYGPSIIDA